MQISVLIEPIGNNGYRATGPEPLPVVVEAPTREEALAKLEEKLEARLRRSRIRAAEDGPRAGSPGWNSLGCSRTTPISRRSLRSWRRTGEKWTDPGRPPRPGRPHEHDRA